MKFDDFKNMIESDPHFLSYKIKNGKISFSSLTIWLTKIENIHPLIEVSYVMHPECTLYAFKKTYTNLLKTPSTIYKFKSTILSNAHIFNNMDAIAFILNVQKTDKMTIKAVYPENRSVFRKLVENPHINTTFKIIFYELTGDEKYLPLDAVDIFLF